MTIAEALETTRSHRVAGGTGARTAFVTTRPFRAPHHTISAVGLIGGGHVPTPGEVSLAQHGVRCLDARMKFRSHGLEVLRQPLEMGVLCIHSPARLRPRCFGRMSGMGAYRSLGSSPLPARSRMALWIRLILVDIGQCRAYRRAILYMGREFLR
jgi:hypothetical protein